MNRVGQTQLTERLFWLGMALKGLDGALEIVSGAALLVVSPDFIRQFAEYFLRSELLEDPHDVVANALLDAVQRLSPGTKVFGELWLLSHGVVKVVLVAALLRGKLWAYPVALAVFGAFIVYQLYRFTLTHGWALIALSAADLIVVWFVWREYRVLQERRGNRAG